MLYICSDWFGRSLIYSRYLTPYTCCKMLHCCIIAIWVWPKTAENCGEHDVFCWIVLSWSTIQFVGSHVFGNWLVLANCRRSIQTSRSRILCGLVIALPAHAGTIAPGSFCWKNERHEIRMSVRPHGNGGATWWGLQTSHDRPGTVRPHPAVTASEVSPGAGRRDAAVDPGSSRSIGVIAFHRPAPFPISLFAPEYMTTTNFYLHIFAITRLLHNMKMFILPIY